MGELTLQALSPEAWQERVEASAEASPFFHRNWIEMLARQYRLKPLLLGLEGAGGWQGLPLLSTPTLSGRSKLVALPFTDHLPLPDLPPALWRQVSRFLEEKLPPAAQTIQLKSSHRLEGAAWSSEDFVHLLELPADFTELKRCFSSSLLRNVKKARKAGLKYETSTSPAALEEFYRLHLETRRRQGTPIQPRRFFSFFQHYILEAGLGFVACIRQQQRPIATAVFLQYKKTLIYKYGASSSADLALRPNDLLFYETLEGACAAGRRLFDFGCSNAKNEGLRRYKSKWGAAEFPVYVNYLMGTPAPASSRSLKLKIIAPLIRNCPPVVCRLIGALFYRYSQ